MGRVSVTAVRKSSAAEKRAAAAIEASEATKDAPARRGESDDDEPVIAPPVEAVVEAVAGPTKVDPAPAVYVPTQNAIVKASEEEGALTYVEPPEDADPLTQIGYARRGIVNANRALTEGLGRLEGSYVLSAGRYLHYATQKGRLRAAGFRSVEAFAASVELTRQDVYRLRKAVPVYEILHDLVTGPLNERTIRELYKTLTNDKEELDVTPERRENLRNQFREMLRTGRVSSGGAAAARRLLALGDATEIIESEPGTVEKPAAVEQLNKVRAARKLAPLELLREVQAEDPEAAKLYLSELRERYEEAASVIEGVPQKV